MIRTVEEAMEKIAVLERSLENARDIAANWKQRYEDSQRNQMTLHALMLSDQQKLRSIAAVINGKT